MLALDSSLTLVAVKAREATVVTNYVVRGFPRPYSISFVAEAAGLSYVDDPRVPPLDSIDLC